VPPELKAQTPESFRSDTLYEVQVKCSKESIESLQEQEHPWEVCAPFQSLGERGRSRPRFYWGYSWLL